MDVAEHRLLGDAYKIHEDTTREDITTVGCISIDENHITIAHNTHFGGSNSANVYGKIQGFVSSIVHVTQGMFLHTLDPWEFYLVEFVEFQIDDLITPLEN